MAQNFLTRPARALYRIATIYALKKVLARTKKPAQPSYSPHSKSLLYVPASCLPYHVSGYTTRTHALLQSLQKLGINLHVLTRPGYPWDRQDRLVNPKTSFNPLHTEKEGVLYQHLPAPSHHRPVLLYVLQAAQAIAQLAKGQKVSCIQAASNHVNALPALLAARSLGIPFFYEMRGLWELTRVSRFPEFEDSEAYKQGLALEGLIATEADRFYVISEALGDYAVQRWGVDASKMALLPNCVDAAQFEFADELTVEPHSIAYAGSLLDYEGLDVLIWALAKLRSQGLILILRIAGEGEARPHLQKLVQDCDLGASVQFLGRLSPSDAQTVIRQSTLVCLPRKPYEVCTLVPPIKMVEALAMGKPVIAPDLPVFQGELGEANSELPGWLFRSGDVDDLARVLREAFLDLAAFQRKSSLAKGYAFSQRHWHRFVQDINAHLP